MCQHKASASVRRFTGMPRLRAAGPEDAHDADAHGSKWGGRECLAWCTQCDSFMDPSPNIVLVCMCSASSPLHSTIAAASSHSCRELKAAVAASAKYMQEAKDNVCFQENGHMNRSIVND